MPVANLPAYRRRVLTRGDRLLKPPRFPQRRAHLGKCYAFACLAALAVRGIKADPQDGHPVIKLPPPGQVRTHVQRQRHGDLIPSGAGG